jgi:hypothetical protein
VENRNGRAAVRLGPRTARNGYRAQADGREIGYDAPRVMFHYAAAGYAHNNIEAASSNLQRLYGAIISKPSR